MRRPDAAASRSLRLTAEYLIVFFGVVGVYIAVRPPGGPIFTVGLGDFFYHGAQR